MNDLHASARSVLLGNVVPLDPAQAVLEAMLEGWGRQQRARFLREATITARLRLVRRFVEFSGLYPWQWGPAEGEAWISSLRSGPAPRALSTLRNYEISIRLFCAYVHDPRYEWDAECVRRFGAPPREVFHEDNSVLHREEYEGEPRRRPLTFDEVQALFDAADGLVEEIRRRGRKGSLSALRDSALLKTCYAFGLRRGELFGADLVDLRGNAKAPRFGRVGTFAVRHGKASRGGPSKRRTVLLVPEMDWVVDVLTHYLQEVRGPLGKDASSALWVSERGSRLSRRAINEAFATARDAAGLDSGLDLHCLRHSYVTHLIEFDYPVRFVQEQVGHAHASTTSIYTGVSASYRNQLLARALDTIYGEHLEQA